MKDLCQAFSPAWERNFSGLRSHFYEADPYMKDCSPICPLIIDIHQSPVLDPSFVNVCTPSDLHSVSSATKFIYIKCWFLNDPNK